MAITRTQKYLTKGNADLMLRALSDNGYSEDITKVSGLIDVSIDYTQEINDIPADDDPSFFSEAGPVTGSGELKLTGILITDLEKFLNVKLNANGGVTIGAYTRPVYRGLAFKSTGADESVDYYCLHKVLFNLPALKTTTITKEGKEVNECTIPLTAYPYFYTASDGKEERATATYFNSKINADIWAKIKDTVYDPSEDLSTPVTPGA